MAPSAAKRRKTARTRSSKDRPDRPPSTGSPIQELPPELLQMIFDNLHVEDVIEARLACPLFAAIGLDHLGSEVALCYHRDRFNAITELAKHPVASKHVLSLHLSADRYAFNMDYEQWNSERPDPEPQLRDITLDDLPDYYEVADKSRWTRAMSRAMKKDYFESKTRKANVSAEVLKQAYDEFCRLRKDQYDIVRTGVDRACLNAVFEGCVNLDEVTLILRGYWQRGRNTLVKRLYAPAMVKPCGDNQWDYAGVHQVRALAYALAQSKKQLDSLTLWEVTHRIFIGKEAVENLKSALRPLKRFRLVIQHQPDEDDLDDSEDDFEYVQEAKYLLENGSLHSVLQPMEDLRILKIQFPTSAVEDEDGSLDDTPVIELDKIFRDITFPHLIELAISKFTCTAGYLSAVILRHRDTLRRLSICDILLKRGTIEKMFTEIAGKIPGLYEVNFRGNFEAIHGPMDLNFDVPGLSDGYVWPARDAVEEFVLKGGEWPDIAALDDLERVKMQNVPGGYVAPGLPGKMSDDDPARFYAWDDLDNLI